MNYLNEAKEVFDIEIAALSKVRDSLDYTFVEILDEITKCDGKVIITGMGKPGHIATKIAATLSSLGTHSFFLHPAEAMHGDVGMVAANDVIIAISYSGESDEIIRLIPAIKMIGAKLIVITGNKNSALSQAADIVQVLPKFEEACHLRLAPTSSTTVELVYGDALAVVASLVYGFRETDFSKYHPAGTLGKKLILKVKDIMAKDDRIPQIKKGSLVIEAIIEMTEKCLSIVCVIDETEKLVGIMTDADLRKAIEKKTNVYDSNIEMIMNSTPRTFSGNRLAVDALRYMRENSLNVMPIIDDNGVLEGVIHWSQIVRAGII